MKSRAFIPALAFSLVVILSMAPAPRCGWSARTATPLLKEGLFTGYVPSTPGEKDPALVLVDFYIPAGKGAGKYSGDILVLPGWKYSRTRWHRETPLIEEARKRGFRLVFPDMTVSQYESEYYPQTQSWVRWGPIPGGRWIKEIFIPDMQKRGLFRQGGRNFLLGLSTGARGVALIHLNNPGLFTAGAALSGDFDQTVMPGDRLMNALYGPLDRYRARWEGKDNPLKRIDEWTMPVYLGHGMKDPVVPFAQTQLFHNTLKKIHPGLAVVFNAAPDAAHDFRYWSSEVTSILEFFISSR